MEQKRLKRRVYRLERGQGIQPKNGVDDDGDVDGRSTRGGRLLKWVELPSSFLGAPPTVLGLCFPLHRFSNLDAKVRST
jgi:hypothetical protein